MLHRPRRENGCFKGIAVIDGFSNGTGSVAMNPSGHYGRPPAVPRAGVSRMASSLKPAA